MADPTTSDLAERYRQMSEPELMQLARAFASLTPTAQDALKQEFHTRSLEPPYIDSPDSESEAGDAPVVVGNYRDLSQALVARAVLEGEGIDCFLQDENTIRQDWALSNAIGGLRLQVSSEDAADARRILAEVPPASFEVDSGSDFIQPICPQCGSLDIIADDTGRRIALASTTVPGLPLLVGVPALALQPEDVWKCMNCGCRWQETDDPDEPSVLPSPVD